MSHNVFKYLMKEIKLINKELKDENDACSYRFSFSTEAEDIEKRRFPFILIGPPDTPYEDGIYKGVFEFPINYPNSPPKVKIFDMFHPNIYEDGTVCISILHKGEDAFGYEHISERWNPSLNVTSVLISIISMIPSPNFDSPANVEASKLWRENYPMFKKIVYNYVSESQKK